MNVNKSKISLILNNHELVIVVILTKFHYFVPFTFALTLSQGQKNKLTTIIIML